MAGRVKLSARGLGDAVHSCEGAIISWKSRDRRALAHTGLYCVAEFLVTFRDANIPTFAIPVIALRS